MSHSPSLPHAEAPTCDVDEVCHILKLGRRSLFNLRDELRPVHVGPGRRKTVYMRSDVQDYLRRCQQRSN